MIWKINLIDTPFVAAWLSAGRPDQAVVNRHGQHPHAQRNAGEPRYYYLLRSDSRIRLATVGLPLGAWQGAGKVLLGTGVIIGEFHGNAHLVGRNGLRLQMEPLDLLSGVPDQEFATGSQALSAISEQIIDRVAIEESQYKIRTQYEWKRR